MRQRHCRLRLEQGGACAWAGAGAGAGAAAAGLEVAGTTIGPAYRRGRRVSWF